MGADEMLEYFNRLCAGKHGIRGVTQGNRIKSGMWLAAHKLGLQLKTGFGVTEDRVLSQWVIRVIA